MQAPFWRDNPLNDREQALLQACLDAHAASAARQNVSSSVAVQAAFGSGSYTNAISAAMLTIGNGSHAPLEYSIQLLTEQDPVAEVKLMLAQNRRVPGWGNSFHKTEPDPLWRDVEIWITRLDPHLAVTLRQITATLHAAKKKIHPNPSTYTACTAILLGIPPRLAPWLFVAGRLNGWSKLVTPYLQ